MLEPVRLGGALALGAVSFRYPGQDEGTKVLSGGLRNYKPLPPKCLCFLGLRVPRSFVRRPLATGELSARFRHL